MQKLLFYSFRRDVHHIFGVVWHPFYPSLPFCLAAREGIGIFPMATRVRSSSRNSCKSFLSTVSERTFSTFLVLFGTRFVLHCHAALLFGKVKVFPMATKVRSSSTNSCKSFFSTVSEGTFGTFFWCCLAPLLSFTAILFCCSGGYNFFPWRQELEAVAETHGFTKDVRHFFGVVLHPICPSLPCCFAVRES